MTGGRAFATAGLVVTILSIVALAFAFILPGKYIGEVEQNMGYSLKQARDAIMAGDMVTAQNSIEDMHTEFQRRQNALKLMCHHDDIDEMEKCITCCRDLVLLEQSDNLICELDQLKKVLEHIDSVENPDVYELF